MEETVRSLCREAIHLCLASEEAEPLAMERAPLTGREPETIMKSPSPHAPRGREAREQLLRDMMSLEDEA